MKTATDDGQTTGAGRWRLAHLGVRRPVIIQRALIGSKRSIFCKVFRDWSIIKTRERNHIYQMSIYLLHFLKQHLTLISFTGVA